MFSFFSDPGVTSGPLSASAVSVTPSHSGSKANRPFSHGADDDKRKEIESRKENQVFLKKQTKID